MNLIYFSLLCSLFLITSSRADLSTQDILKSESSEHVPWPPPDEDELDRYIRWLLDGYHVPGLALAIVDNDKIAAKGYGYARLNITPATADTLWFTGSTTKAFTAAAFAILMEDKDRYPKLTWKSKIHDYMPADFVLSDDYATKHITIEDALTHRSGMPSHDRAYGWANMTLTDLVQSLRFLPLTQEPRYLFQYCNTMVMTVSKLLEVVTNESVSSLLRRLIWQPLGMRSTFFFPQDLETIEKSNVKARLARGYYWVDELNANGRGAHYVSEPYMDLNIVSGAGATVSSVNDYALWIKALLQQDPYTPRLSPNYSCPITRMMYSDLVHPRVFIPGDGISGVSAKDYRRGEGYGLGWITSSISGYTLITHAGSLTGFATQIWMVPDLQIGVVVMSNTQDSKVVADLIGIAVLRKKIEGNSIERIKSQDLQRPTARYDTAFMYPSAHNIDRRTEQQGPEMFAGESISIEATAAFVGIYHHPAYGTLNITLAQDTAPERYWHWQDSSEKLDDVRIPDMHVQPSKRTWSFDYYLQHDTGAWFQATRWEPHGTHNEDPIPGLDNDCYMPLCRTEIVMVRDGSPSFAHFEFDPRPIGEGPRFQRAMRFGIHLSDATRSAAEGYQYGGWKEGAIWFERQN